MTSAIQPSYNGQYYIQNMTYNGDPIYSRLDCNLNLFLYEEPSDVFEYYLIGPSVGVNTGAVFNPVQFMLNPQGTMGWSAYSSATSQFVSDPSVSVTCSCNSKFVSYSTINYE